MKKESKKIGILNKHCTSLANFDEGERYAGVHITSDFTEVTNGFYLLRIDNPSVNVEDLPSELPQEGETDLDVVLSKEAVKDVHHELKKKKSSEILTYGVVTAGSKERKKQVKIRTYDNYGGERVAEIKCSKIIFLDTDRAFPMGEPRMELLVNPRYLFAVAKFLNSQVRRGVDAPSVKVSIYDSEREPVRFEFIKPDTGQKTVALLMPITKPS